MINPTLRIPENIRFQFEIVAITRLTTIQATYENDDGRNLLEFPSLQYRHMIDLFDRAQIYGTFQSLLTAYDNDQDFYCFYYGLNDIPRIFKKFTVQNSHNRNFSLEEILHTVAIIFKLTSISITYVSLRKLRLITKEMMKNVYLNPKDPQLWPFNISKIIQRKQIFALGPKFQLENKPIEQYQFECSLNDDLENLLESTRNNDFKPDSKHIFLTKLLTTSETNRLESKDHDFSNTFYNSDYDVSIERMLESNSKSKYDLWSGFRTSVNIPSNDYPFIDEPGFSLSPYGNPWMDPYRQLTYIVIDNYGENVDWQFDMYFDWHLNHSPLIGNIDPSVYCQNYDSLQYYTIGKKAGEYEVLFDLDFVNAYDLVDIDALEPTCLYMFFNE